MFNLIVSTDNKGGIAKNGVIPWHCKKDMEFFKQITEEGVVIMGRKTWESISKKNRPLPNRINIIISTTYNMESAKKRKRDGDDRILFNSANNNTSVKIMPSVIDVIEHFSKNKTDRKLFVVGGESIYKQFLNSRYVSCIYKTVINYDFKCDQFFHHIKGNEVVLEMNNNLAIVKYDMKNIYVREEINFLNLLRKVLDSGVKRNDRTRTGTLSIFSHELRFDLSHGHIPMCTTRPLSLKIIFEELMWILRGQTDNKILQKKNIHIWDDNTTREFLDNQGLDYDEGEIGPSYGFQMRNFGGKYKSRKKEEKGENGFDQLNYVIELLKNNPESRRIVINLWNPSQLKEMALPPCVYGYQFYVAKGKLSCKMIQRSSDISLAGSHNCASGALFVRLLCAITNLEPGELIWSPADIHIYTNQIAQTKQQISRRPTPYPTLVIKSVPNSGNILDFTLKNIKLVNYNPQSRIRFKMNA